MAHQPDRLDARGLKCPLPVLKLEKRLARLKPGTTLTVLATDPIAKIDIPLYCVQNGHACAVSEQPGWLEFTITAQEKPGAGVETE